MGDTSIKLYRENGKVKRIGKIMGNKELIFKFRGEKIVPKPQIVSLKDRLPDREDLYVPKEQINVARRQVAAIWKELFYKKDRDKKSGHRNLRLPFKKPSPTHQQLSLPL